MAHLPPSITLIEWMQIEDLKKPIKEKSYAILEKALLKYFRENKERILEMQHLHMERGDGIDLVTATEYALREDIEDPLKNRDHLTGLDNALQYVMGLGIVSNEGSTDKRRLWRVMEGISGEFRKKYAKYMQIYENLLEKYSPQTFQQCFLQMAER